MNEDRGVLLIDSNGEVIDTATNPGACLVFGLSWLAYVREVPMFFVRLFLYLIPFIALPGGWSALALVCASGHTAYKIALLRAVRLYTDGDGVWLQTGVFPWQKGVSGVQWRDVGQAGYQLGFLSWVCKSYEVVITHRFSTGEELRLRHVKYGDVAVKHINVRLTQLQRAVMQGLYR